MYLSFLLPGNWLALCSSEESYQILMLLHPLNIRPWEVLVLFAISCYNTATVARLVFRALANLFIFQLCVRQLPFTFVVFVSFLLDWGH